MGKTRYQSGEEHVLLVLEVSVNAADPPQWIRITKRLPQSTPFANVAYWLTAGALKPDQQVDMDGWILGGIKEALETVPSGRVRLVGGC